LNAVLYNRTRSELQLSLSQVQQQFKQNILVVFTPAPELAFQTAKSNIPIVVQHPDNLVSQQFAKLADSITKHMSPKT
jgi:MinD-like ATPase involved in chromosome partitioning or flagellar assembly